MKQVLLLLCKGTEVYEAATFYDVLGWSGAEGGEEVRVVAAGTTEEVTCSFGLRVKSDVLVENVEVGAYDAIAVPGGFEEYGFYEDAYSERIAALIRTFHEAGKPVASICVGALPVANSGILRGRRGTTYALGGGRRRRQLADFGVEVIDTPVVCEHGIGTSTGPSTAVDVAFWLLDRLTGAENAGMVRGAMGFGPA